MRKFNALIMILTLAGALFGCQKKELAKTQSQEIIPVKVMAVNLQTLKQILEYVGNIKAQDEAIVYPKVSGKIIEKVKEDGAPVAKGETIAYIDRDEVGLIFEKAPVESPLSGLVGRFYVDRGENVTTQTQIALVVNMDKVKIDLDIPEKYLPQISLGQKAKINTDAYPQEEFEGVVTKISPVVDLATRSAPIQITVDNQAGRLKSGMFARVKLILVEHKEVPAILKEALIIKQGSFWVYIVENKKALLKKVSLGLRQAELVEIKEGLNPGERVVIMGQQRLFDGAAVEPEE